MAGLDGGDIDDVCVSEQPSNYRAIAVDIELVLVVVVV